MWSPISFTPTYDFCVPCSPVISPTFQPEKHFSDSQLASQVDDLAPLYSYSPPRSPTPIVDSTPCTVPWVNVVDEYLSPEIASMVKGPVRNYEEKKSVGKISARKTIEKLIQRKPFKERSVAIEKSVISVREFHKYYKEKFISNYSGVFKIEFRFKNRELIIFPICLVWTWSESDELFQLIVDHLVEGDNNPSDYVYRERGRKVVVYPMNMIESRLLSQLTWRKCPLFGANALEVSLSRKHSDLSDSSLPLRSIVVYVNWVLKINKD